MPFDPPANPGQALTVPEGAMGLHIIIINGYYRQNVMIFKENHDTDKARKVFIMYAIYETYIHALQDRYVGYVNVTTLYMLTHLYTNYMRITPNYLQENIKIMKAPWEPNQLCDTLVGRVTDRMEYVSAGGNMYSLGQFLMIAYNVVFNTKETGKIWENFKTHHTTRHPKIQEMSRNARAMGYGVNFMSDEDIEKTENEMVTAIKIWPPQQL